MTDIIIFILIPVLLVGWLFMRRYRKQLELKEAQLLKDEKAEVAVERQTDSDTVDTHPSSSH